MFTAIKSDEMWELAILITSFVISASIFAACSVGV
jgi:hypothetical protein